MRIPVAVLTALLLLPAACGSDEPVSSEAPTTQATVAASESELPPPPSAPAETEAAVPQEEESDPAPVEAAGEVAVVLEPGGLGFADESGAITHLAFGEADTETTTAALTTALGEPTSQQDALECGPGALDAVNWDGLTAFFQEGAFVGWFVQEPTPGDLTTANGIGIGSKLGDLRAAFGDVTVEETTIGFEFAAGELFGTLTADSDHDTVVTMWSGANCIAR